ncbi:hypothetical protein PENSPDRAFT_105210 [Peniophora sp. CONT]|nr:hypothetical protein PENSPDRAFT_105210 [Peniophora sp. CONT]
MSSTTPTPTFTPPGLSTAAADPTGAPASASSGATISTGNSGPSTSSSLYPHLQRHTVYTFLVTLALLLSISAAIITRSYVLRRRLRALVAAGVLPPEALIHTPRRHGGLGGNVNVGKRPVMYEVWPAEKRWDGEGDEGGSVGEKAAPLSLAPLAALLAAQAQAPPPIIPESTPRRPPRPVQRPSFAVPFFSRRDPYSPTPAPRIADISSADTPLPSRRWPLLPFTRPSKPPTTPTEPGTELTSTTRDTEAEDMQLALLVAMPVEPGTKGRGTGEVPVLEIGVRVVAGRV